MMVRLLRYDPMEMDAALVSWTRGGGGGEVMVARATPGAPTLPPKVTLNRGAPRLCRYRHVSRTVGSNVGRAGIGGVEGGAVAAKHRES